MCTSPGGNRCSRARQIRNILTVWLLTGLWHGAAWTFILWGLWFCLPAAGEKFLWGHFLEQLPSPIRWACTMLAVIPQLGAVPGGGSGPGVGLSGRHVRPDHRPGPGRSSSLLPAPVLAGVDPSPSSPSLPGEAVAPVLAGGPGAAGQTLSPCGRPRVLALGLLVLSYGLLVTGSFNPFIYFQF